jgi:hypothetical protein
MSYRVKGLDPAPFRHLYGLSEEALARLGVERHIADSKPGFPDRIEVRDAEPGESLLLLNFTHQPGDTPYRASHAIFVREGADLACDSVGEIPEPLRTRPISLRAFGADHRMIDADLVDGPNLEGLVERFLANPAIDYLHAHYARRGCYAARIERA